MAALRLDRLELQNYRGFDNCILNFHPQLNAIVAENGGGKTALLNASALALSAIVNGIDSNERLRCIDRSDVRMLPTTTGLVPSLPTRFCAHGYIAGNPACWESTVTNFGSRVRSRVKSLRSIASAVRTFKHTNATLPLVAFYGTARLSGEHRLTESRRTSVTEISGRLTGYDDCLTSAPLLKGVSAWYERRARRQLSPTNLDNWAKDISFLKSVKNATNTVLKPTGWSNLEWDPNVQGLTAQHCVFGRLPVAALSDGIRMMFALTADVARRCVTLNPQLGDKASKKTPGVLLIDEVDMHLHPRWQQLVMKLLAQAFPALQIIISTHSPHVVSKFQKGTIRVIRLRRQACR